MNRTEQWVSDRPCRQAGMTARFQGRDRESNGGFIRTWTLAWAALIGLSPMSTTEASTRELVTDRPDFTESAVVVAHGSVQLESGTTWTDETDGETVSGPELLVRWGLVEGFELRFGLPDRLEPSRGSGGISDASLGAKFEFGATASGWQRAIIAETSLPTGDDRFTSDRFDPGLLFILGRDLGEHWSLGTQAQIGRVSQGDQSLTALGATVVVGRGLGERYGLFAELAVEEVEDQETSILLHHGYTVLVRSNLQLDIHFGVGLSDGAPDALVGFGLSWRR